MSDSLHPPPSPPDSDPGIDGKDSGMTNLMVEELRRLARAKLSRLPPGQTLQATALVNEAFLRLAGALESKSSPDEYVGFAARAMQDVLVESARRKASLRGGGAWRRTLEFELSLATEAAPEEILSLNEALEKLAIKAPRKADLVRLRFFAGLSERECAEHLNLDVRTIRRDWRYSRSWLLAELEDAGDEG